MKFKVSNFRGYENSDWIEINKMNILLGKNSTGKSSLTRFLPLIKQTIENKKNEPIIWYTPDFVDFGSYEDTIFNRNKTKSMILSFKFDLPFETVFKNILEKKQLFFELVNSMEDKKSEEEKIVNYLQSLNNIEHTIDLEIKDNYVKTVNITYNEYQFSMEYSKSKELLKISSKYIKNGETLTHDFSTSNLVYLSNSLFPSYKYFKKIKESRNDSSEVKLVKNLTNNKEGLINLALQELYELTNLEPLNENQIKILNSHLPFSLEDQISVFNNLFNYNNDFSTNNFDYEEFFLVSNFLNLPILISAIEIHFKNYFSNLTYIKPVRATFERYYRLQSHTITEVTSSGSNVPMILATMTPEDLKLFNNFTKEYFSLIISKKVENGHISILISTEETDWKEKNIVDLGFGYSQILPIIFSIWLKFKKANTTRKSPTVINKIPRTIIIEQPELHLHPSMQSEFIQTCIKLINIINKNPKKYEPIQFILETHSETIVNTIGLEIEEDNFNHEDVNIYMINLIDSKSEVSKTTFDEEGQLVEWPIGFFSPGILS